MYEACSVENILEIATTFLLQKHRWMLRFLPLVTMHRRNVWVWPGQNLGFPWYRDYFCEKWYWSEECWSWALFERCGSQLCPFERFSALYCKQSLQLLIINFCMVQKTKTALNEFLESCRSRRWHASNANRSTFHIPKRALFHLTIHTATAASTSIHTKGKEPEKQPGTSVAVVPTFKTKYILFS